MKGRTLILGFLAAFLMAACEQRIQQDIRTPRNSFYISPVNLVISKLRAKSGDTEAAARVAEYYAFYRNNTHEAKQWFELAGIRVPSE